MGTIPGNQSKLVLSVCPQTRKNPYIKPGYGSYAKACATIEGDPKRPCSCPLKNQKKTSRKPRVTPRSKDNFRGKEGTKGGEQERPGVPNMKRSTREDGPGGGKEPYVPGEKPVAERGSVTEKKIQGAPNFLTVGRLEKGGNSTLKSPDQKNKNQRRLLLKDNKNPERTRMRGAGITGLEQCLW